VLLDPLAVYVGLYGLVFLFALNLGLMVTHFAERRRWGWQRKNYRSRRRLCHGGSP
jgi:hypothetical protein